MQDYNSCDTQDDGGDIIILNVVGVAGGEKPFRGHPDDCHCSSVVVDNGNGSVAAHACRED